MFSFGSAMVLPMAIVAVFPYGSIGFKASAVPAAPRPFAAFVTLSPQEEARATSMVKAAWQSGSGELRRIRADLAVGELPEDEAGPVLDISAADLRIPPAERSVEAPPFPPSMRAAPPERLPSRATAPESAAAPEAPAAPSPSAAAR
jgi:hypothetical protein